MAEQIRGPFEKVVDSLYYSKPLLFFEIPPLASDTLLTTLHPLLENVLQAICRRLHEDSGTGGFESTDREMKITPLLRYPHPCNLA
jgi:hypothetical protein